MSPLGVASMLQVSLAISFISSLLENWGLEVLHLLIYLFLLAGLIA